MDEKSCFPNDFLSTLGLIGTFHVLNDGTIIMLRLRLLPSSRSDITIHRSVCFATNIFENHWVNHVGTLRTIEIKHDELFQIMLLSYLNISSARAAPHNLLRSDSKMSVLFVFLHDVVCDTCQWNGWVSLQQPFCIFIDTNVVRMRKKRRRCTRRSGLYRRSTTTTWRWTLPIAVWVREFTRLSSTYYFISFVFFLFKNVS